MIILIISVLSHLVYFLANYLHFRLSHFALVCPLFLQSRNKKYIKSKAWSSTSAIRVSFQCKVARVWWCIIMLWFNFITFQPIGFNYIFLCLKLIIIHYHNSEENNTVIQNNNKIEPQLLP